MTVGVSVKFIREVAENLSADPAAVYAVCKAECGDKPFFPADAKTPLGFAIPGKPKILFEPHVWWTRLKLHGMDPAALLRERPELEDILYAKWGAKPYGSEKAQYDKLLRAIGVHPDSAVESVSYGAFQIMGYHWADLGWPSAQAFYEDMLSGGVERHADAFIKFCKFNNLIRHIKPGAVDFAKFARGYNGSGYAKNKYDIRMAEYYKEAKGLGL